MAINKNHEFEELNGVKCGIVERNISSERLEFLKHLLELNGFETQVVIAPPPKGTVLPKEGEPPLPETYTLGVTDYTFNPTNAIFGRSLKSPEGKVVTLNYWLQKEAVSNDEVPYYAALSK